MKSILYIIAFIMIVGWLIGLLVYSIGAVIHILLVVAVIFVLFNLFGVQQEVQE